MGMVLLTKSKFVTGIQCPKLLWLQVHEPGRIPEKAESEIARLDEGTLIGEVAKEVFPKGVDLAGLDFDVNIEKTEDAVKQKKTIFEAGLLAGDCFSRIDVFKPAKSAWDIIEVKGTTEVKDQHIPDVAFQKYCAEQKGLKIRKCFVMHLNKEYVRKGEIEPEKLFSQTDVTAEVDEYLPGVPKQAKQLKAILNSKTCPKVDIGVHCSDPYECPVEECWDFLPENNVCNLYRLKGEKAFQLISEGIYSIKQLPEDFALTNNQEIQKQCERTGKPHVDKRGIKAFLDLLEHPLYFMDFETFNTGIPMFDGLKPYQQVPFQFSLHTVAKKGAKPKHVMFLAEGKEDPRKDFLAKLKAALGSEGSVVVYNQSFESRILKELAEAFPTSRKWYENVRARMADLLVPFRNFSYYNPKQQGSASIKAVLPAITGKGYENMEIADGGTASIAFIKATYENTPEKERKKLRKALEEYCTLDTEAMIRIVEQLNRIII